MSLFINDYVELVQEKVKTPPDVDGDVWLSMVEEGILKYSTHRPRILVEDLTGFTNFDIALPAGWIDHFSSMQTVEFPVNAAVAEPSYLRIGTEYTLYETPTGTVLRLLDQVPVATDTIRIAYTAPHQVGTAITTVPELDERCIANYSAGLMCEILAAEYERKTRSSLPETVFEARGKSVEYQTQADRYYRLWRDHMGLSDPEDGGAGAVEAAVAWGDYDMKLSSGYPLLTHNQEIQ